MKRCCESSCKMPTTFGLDFLILTSTCLYRCLQILRHLEMLSLGQRLSDICLLFIYVLYIPINCHLGDIKQLFLQTYFSFRVYFRYFFRSYFRYNLTVWGHLCQVSRMYLRKCQSWPRGTHRSTSSCTFHLWQGRWHMQHFDAYAPLVHEAPGLL